MPRHEFRTIEAFVQLLEGFETKCRTVADVVKPGDYRSRKLGRADAIRDILAIVRTSNLGIVYPPSETKS